MKFDLIFGNLPHQEPAKRANGYTIWQKRVSASLDMLKEGGYLCYVHPAGWRRPLQRHGLYDKLVKHRQMTYLNVNDKLTGKKEFGYTSRFDYYVVHNTPKYTSTKLVDEKGVTMDIDLSRFDYLPNFALWLYEKLSAPEGKKINAQCVRTHRLAYDHVSTEPSLEFKYPICDKTANREFKLVWSKTPHIAQYKPKVLFDRNGRVNAIFDSDGAYGTTQNTYFVEVDNYLEGVILLTLLNSDIMDYFVKSTKWSHFEIEYLMFNSITMPSFTSPPSEQDIMNFYGITREDLERIE